jgi:hypothetical protein
MTANEAIKIIEGQYGIKLFAYQKFILRVLWKKSHKTTV